MKTTKFLLALFILSFMNSAANTSFSTPNAYVVFDTVVGKLSGKCWKGKRIDTETNWNKFSQITVIKDENDWTVSGIATRDIGGEYSFVIDVLKSKNKFEVRVDNSLWTAQLSDTLAVSYRISDTKLIVRAIKVPNSLAPACQLTGMITAEIK